jgi:tellurite resistance protein TerC
MGLRALYFILADLIERFAYLKYGLALLLVLIGVKMLIHDWYEVPVWGVLTGVVVIVGASIVASFLATAGDHN